MHSKQYCILDRGICIKTLKDVARIVSLSFIAFRAKIIIVANATFISPTYDISVTAVTSNAL